MRAYERRRRSTQRSARRCRTPQRKCFSARPLPSYADAAPRRTQPNPIKGVAITELGNRRRAGRPRTGRWRSQYRRCITSRWVLRRMLRGRLGASSSSRTGCRCPERRLAERRRPGGRARGGPEAARRAVVRLVRRRPATGASPKPVELHDVGNVTYAVIDLSQRDLDDYLFRLRQPGALAGLPLPPRPDRLLPAQHGRAISASTSSSPGGSRRCCAPDDVDLGARLPLHPARRAICASMGFANRIGFFLHIPWPPSDVASALPAYDLLLRGFAAYDVVGFQTPLDADNFVSVPDSRRDRPGARRRLSTRRSAAASRSAPSRSASTRRLSADGRGGATRNARSCGACAASLEGKQLIIGVDRLDYSKGIGQRIEAFSCFLESNPQLRNRVTYLQITPKSRSEVPEYAEMQREVAEQIGRHQRPLRRCRLDADPLHQQARSATPPCRPLPAGAASASSRRCATA